LQVSPRALQDVDGPALADEHVADQETGHGTADDDRLLHRPPLAPALSHTAWLRRGSRFVIPAERLQRESRDPCTPASPSFLMPGYMVPGLPRWALRAARRMDNPRSLQDGI